MIRRRSVSGFVAVATSVAVSVAFFGCSESTERSESGDRPASLEQVSAPDGSKVMRVVLTERGSKRLGLRTEPVAEQLGTLVVPYSAVVYDDNGAAWVYARTRPRSFQRAPITIRTIEGQDVLLASGPDAGTQVVTVGSSELLGAEHEIG